MPLISTHNLDVFADFYQFWLQDESVDIDWSDAWTEEATSRMLAVAPGVVAVGTARNVDVPVILELHDDEPESDLQEWDRMVECALTISSGRIIIVGCTDYFPKAARVEVPPGLYKVRVSYSGLSTVSDDGLDGEDCYRVQLWPGLSSAPHVLK